MINRQFLLCMFLAFGCSLLFAQESKDDWLNRVRIENKELKTMLDSSRWQDIVDATKGAKKAKNGEAIFLRGYAFYQLHDLKQAVSLFNVAKVFGKKKWSQYIPAMMVAGLITEEKGKTYARRFFKAGLRKRKKQQLSKQDEYNFLYHVGRTSSRGTKILRYKEAFELFPRGVYEKEMIPWVVQGYVEDKSFAISGPIVQRMKQIIPAVEWTEGMTLAAMRTTLALNKSNESLGFVENYINRFVNGDSRPEALYEWGLQMEKDHIDEAIDSYTTILGMKSRSNDLGLLKVQSVYRLLNLHVNNGWNPDPEDILIKNESLDWFKLLEKADEEKLDHIIKIDFQYLKALFYESHAEYDKALDEWKKINESIAPHPKRAHFISDHNNIYSKALAYVEKNHDLEKALYFSQQGDYLKSHQDQMEETLRFLERMGMSEAAVELWAIFWDSPLLFKRQIGLWPKYVTSLKNIGNWKLLEPALEKIVGQGKRMNADKYWQVISPLFQMASYPKVRPFMHQLLDMGIFPVEQEDEIRQEKINQAWVIRDFDQLEEWRKSWGPEIFNPTTLSLSYIPYLQRQWKLTVPEKKYISSLWSNLENNLALQVWGFYLLLGDAMLGRDEEEIVRLQKAWDDRKISPSKELELMKQSVDTILAQWRDEQRWRDVEGSIFGS